MGEGTRRELTLRAVRGAAVGLGVAVAVDVAYSAEMVRFWLLGVVYLLGWLLAWLTRLRLPWAVSLFGLGFAAVVSLGGSFFAIAQLPLPWPYRALPLVLTTASFAVAAVLVPDDWTSRTEPDESLASDG